MLAPGLALRTRGQSEAKCAEVFVETEDLADAMRSRDRRADGISETELDVRVSLEDGPALRVEPLIDPDDPKAARAPRTFDRAPETERGLKAGVVAKPRRGLGHDVVAADEPHTAGGQLLVARARGAMEPVVPFDQRDPRTGIDERRRQSRSR